MEGTRWMLVEETEDSVCDQESAYVVAVPIQLDIHEALGICRGKLNNSIIPYQGDLASHKVYTDWYYNTTHGP